MSKFTDRLRIVRYFSDEIMAARMPADEDLIFNLRKDRKDAAAIIDEMEILLRDVTNSLAKFVDADAHYKEDYESPLSAYDRAEKYLAEFEERS